MENIILSKKNNNRSDIRKFLKDICVIDTNYRNKHNKLIEIYNQYNEVYNEPEVLNNLNNNTEYTFLIKNEIEKPMNSVYLMLKKNSEEMYKNRLNVIEIIKDDNTLTSSDKQNISNYLIEMYKSDIDNKPCCLEPIFQSSEFMFYNNRKPLHNLLSQQVNLNKNIPNSESQDVDTGVDINTLDKAYLKKHNELVQMFKAYQVLFQKVGDYKTKLDKYKKMATSPLISNQKMKKLLDDQKFIMSSVDEMQKQLMDMNIIKPEERIPTNPVINQTKNIGMFNDRLKKQMNNILIKRQNIDTSSDDRNIKDRIFNILKQKLNDKSISYIVR